MFVTRALSAHVKCVYSRSHQLNDCKIDKKMNDPLYLVSIAGSCAARLALSSEELFEWPIIHQSSIVFRAVTNGHWSLRMALIEQAANIYWGEKLPKTRMFR